MFNWINKSRKKNLVLASIILVSLTLITASIQRSPKPFFLETVFIWMVAPFQNFFSNMVNSVEDVTKWIAEGARFVLYMSDARAMVEGFRKDFGAIQKQVAD